MIEVVRYIFLSLLAACGGSKAAAPTAEPVPPPPVDAALEPAVDAQPVVSTPPPVSCAPVCIGDITTDGPVNLGGLRAAIQNNVGLFAACFAGLDVRVTASMLLLRVGSATNIQVDGAEPSVTDCIARQLAHTAFPYLDAQLHVTIPLSSS